MDKRIAMTIVFALVPSALFAQNTPIVDEDAQAKAALELASQVASSMTIHARPNQGEPVALKLRETPLLRWSNPEVGSIHGAVFLWTDDNRPQLIASIFKWYSPYTWFDAELHSLSEYPLATIREEKPFWSTENKAIAFKRLSGAPVPAETPAKRLSQMRAIVREMAGEQTDRDTRAKQTLRLLDSPLYRYQSNKHAIIDGGLFALVWTTDPQIIVMIEAKNDGKESVWQAAFIRQTSCALQLERKEQLLFQADELPWPVAYSNKELYNIIRISEK